MQEKARLDRQTIALRVAREFQDGDVVNLGLGLPGLTSNFVPAGREVLFHAEPGVLGYGEITNFGEGDLELTNASGQTVREQPGMCYFDHAEAFVMIRGGHVDISVMDLAYGAKRVIVAMSHTTKDGKPRILKKCTYPLTALNSVDLIVTDLAVIEVTSKGLVLKEVAPGWTPEEVQSLTEPRLIISPDCQEMTLI
jgi:acyl CoA:acetate/3-ketoacid CoA transferase beta subunit